MRARFVREMGVDTNPYGEIVTLVIDELPEEAGSSEPFRLRFDLLAFRYAESRTGLVGKIGQDVQDWMLGLPGDITAMERDLNGLMHEAWKAFCDRNSDVAAIMGGGRAYRPERKPGVR